MTIDRRYSVAEGQAIKAPCACATTANITLSGAQTIDGVAVTETSPPTRVLVKNQTTAAENGIYDVANGAWTRSRDFDGSYDIVTGTRVFVVAGTTNLRTEYYVATTGTITIDTTSITFGAVYQGGAQLPAMAEARLLIGQAAGDPLAKDISGDITITAAGVVAVPADTITFAKMQNMATDRVLGRDTAGSGNIEELTLTQILDFIGSAAQGDLLFRGAAGWQRLAASTSGLFLKTLGPGADPAWSTVTVSDQIFPATQAEQETGTSLTVATTPGRQHYHASACKAWVRFNASGTIAAGYNVTSVTDNGVGDWTANFTTQMSSANYCAVGIAGWNGAIPSQLFLTAHSLTTSGARVRANNDAGNAADPDATGFNAIFVACFGDHS